MVLVKMIAFVVLKIFHSLVFMQKTLFINNCKIRKSAPSDLTFILVVLSESVISFVCQFCWLTLP